MPNYNDAVNILGLASPLSRCARLGSYAPSIDVYGSYFPAWLICLVIGVVLTVLVSLIARFFEIGSFRSFGPLLPVSLILIFSITTWFLFFAS
jgi:YtcA family